MIFKLELVEKNVQQVLSIRTRTTMENLPNLIGEAYGRIMKYLEEQGEQPVDAPFTAYHNLDMKDLDVEMGFPVKIRLQGKDDIKAIEVPGGKFITCMYKGAYSGMEKPYNEMFKWIAENGYEQKGIYYEYYFNSPAEVPESELLTRIEMPLK